MSPDLTICNLALGHLGVPALTSGQLTANILPAAKACNLFFSSAVDDLFSEYKWPFADACISLNLSSTTSLLDDQWAYVYDYPTTNCSAVWDVYNESTFDKKTEQDYETKYDADNAKRIICTDLEDALADITYPVTDTSLWNNKFKLALSYRLAAIMAISVGASAEKALALAQVADMQLSNTKRIGSSEQRKKPNFSSATQDARG